MPLKNISIGIDFDNTIVCYDEIFHQIALEKELIPRSTPKNKENVRNYLRQVGKEDIWSEMQGYVYGTRMSEVSAFPGALDCIARLKENSIPVFIISHKTRRPFKGKAYDLHAAAREWLTVHGLSMNDVFFKETKQEKLSQIGLCRCTHFIDDLPEFLEEPSFPAGTQKLLFSPTKIGKSLLSEDVTLFNTWHEIAGFLLGQ